MSPFWKLLSCCSCFFSSLLSYRQRAILVTSTGQSPPVWARPLSRLYVRNVDLPEALVFYDVYHRGDWTKLILQCIECGTEAVVIDEKPHLDNSPSAGKSPPAKLALSLVWSQATVDPPNPKDLWRTIQSITIHPRPFGGSSGFAASQSRDPPRSPLPSRVVVIGSSLEHSRAARLAGMRVISLDEQDHLADAVLSVEEIQDLWQEDLATPGSFWLNPPHPRDDNGNRVDPEKVLELLEAGPVETLQETAQESAIAGLSDDIDDDEIARILADMAELPRRSRKSS